MIPDIYVRITWLSTVVTFRTFPNPGNVVHPPTARWRSALKLNFIWDQIATPEHFNYDAVYPRYSNHGGIIDNTPCSKMVNIILNWQVAKSLLRVQPTSRSSQSTISVPLLAIFFLVLLSSVRHNTLRCNLCTKKNMLSGAYDTYAANLIESFFSDMLCEV
jgi:hypothetical protein